MSDTNPSESRRDALDELEPRTAITDDTLRQAVSSLRTIHDETRDALVILSLGADAKRPLDVDEMARAIRSIGRAADAARCILEDLEREGVADDRHGFDSEAHRQWKAALTDVMRAEGAFRGREGGR